MGNTTLKSCRRMLVLASTLATSLSGGCADERAPTGSDELSAATHCPDSHIPWDFKHQPVRFNTEFYQVADPGGPTPVPIAQPRPLIQSIDCEKGVRHHREAVGHTAFNACTPDTWANNPGIEFNVGRKVATEVVDRCNSSVCSVPPSCKVTFSCNDGVHTVGDDTKAFTCGQYRGQDWKPLIDCKQSVEAVEGQIRALGEDGIAHERPDGAVCVPRYCNGKAHRNLDLECVTDESMPELPLRDISSMMAQSSTLTVDINPGATAIETPTDIREIRRGTSYKFALDLDLGSRDASAFKDARMTVWLSEIWEYEPSNGPKQTVEIFGCFLTSPKPSDDFGPTGNQLRYRADVEPPAECGANNEALVRRLLPQNLGASYSFGKVGARVNHTLDVEGRYAIFDGSDPKGDRKAIDSCAPNPPDFFTLIIAPDGPDGKKQQMPDMLEYLRQRQIDGQLWGSEKGRFTGPGRSLKISDPYQNTRIGMLAADIGKAKVSVTQDGRQNTSVPVDFSWFQANHGQKEPVVLPDSLNLQAGIYLWPTDRAGERAEYPRVGSVKLTSAGRTGNGVATTAVIDAALRKQIFDPSSPLYISRSQFMRSFEVVACIEADGVEARYFKSRQQPYHTRVPLMIGKGINSLDNSGYKPSGALPPGPGCAYSKTPLLVEALYLSYPVPPTSNKPRDQQKAAVRTGSGRLAATQDSTTDMGCAGTGGTSCRNSSNAGLSSSGEVSRSFYASRNSQQQTPPAKGKEPTSSNTVTLDGTAEAMGFQLLDLVKGELSKRVTWPEPAITLETRLAIPLDDAADALREAATGQENIEWKEGRFAGQDGLGLSIGVKVKFLAGPIPGELKIAFSVGIAASILSTITYFDSDLAAGSITEFGNAYPCLDGVDCAQAEEDESGDPVTKSFADAVEYCRRRGGRLAQLDTEEKAANYFDAVESSGIYWTGGQQAWAYRDPQCDVAFNTSCLSGAVSSYRWLSDNTEFAQATGPSAATWNSDPSYFFGASQVSLVSALPVMSALAINAATEAPSLQPVTSKQRVLCEYPAADYDLYQSTTFGLELTASAGFGASLCVPSDDFGLCLGGSINVASVTFTPQFQYESHQVFLKNRLVQRVGQTGFVGPWSVTLLDGELYGEIHLFFITLKKTIIAFGGFRVAGGELFDERTPFITPGEMP
jgi:hypothetical protein